MTLDEDEKLRLTGLVKKGMEDEQLKCASKSILEEELRHLEQHRVVIRHRIERTTDSEDILAQLNENRDILTKRIGAIKDELERRGKLGLEY